MSGWNSLTGFVQAGVSREVPVVDPVAAPQADDRVVVDSPVVPDLVVVLVVADLVVVLVVADLAAVVGGPSHRELRNMCGMAGFNY